ncbi:MAG TPA: hypothetical protein VGF55_22655 [Gemmataceae bacterium]|jgi:hypothetical protein
MNATTSPISDGPDDLDRRLGAFFHGEVPTPWPTLKAPVTTPVQVRGGTLTAGRLALAASVAALLAGGWLLGRLPGPPAAGSLDNGTATVPMDLRPGDSHPMTPPGR